MLQYIFLFFITETVFTDDILDDGISVSLNQQVIEYGDYIWNYLCHDDAGNSAWAPNNFTFSRQDATVTQDNPILNSTDGLNTSFENLTCNPQNQVSPINASIKNIYNWKVNGTSLALLNLPFEGGSNSTYTRDYVNGNNGSVVNGVHTMYGGWDNNSYYNLSGDTDYVQIPRNDALDVQNALSVS